ncbi:hypothetical protein O6H91_22G055500 [Diphasiastrum complanatum]|uniref:Uncharacterized protein n=1 Tax=Diphasiastrum complanatum TaxID=34168 RepID=A0ACC2AFY2_DIPCM|nr:hypothetical protein O6H91_22G055500 [Diphasiastrum complanatum]
MDAKACQAKLLSVQELEDFVPGSHSREDLFSDVETLHCLDLEGSISPRKWSLLIEEFFPDREYTSVEVQSSPDSWSLTPDLAEEICGYQTGFVSGFSSSTVCSSNNDESGEKEPLSGQLVCYTHIKSTECGAKDCSISKPTSSRQKRTLPTDLDAKRSQRKPRAKTSKKSDFSVKCAPPPVRPCTSNADLTLCEQVLSATISAAKRSNSALISLPSGKESHIWTERERRKKMNSMFSSLQSLLPNLPPKADKSTVIDEAISYIQSLETTLLNAEVNRKARTCPSPSPSSDQRQPPQSSVPLSPSQAKDMDLSFQTLSSPNALLNVCGTDAFVTVCSSRLSSLESLFSPLENDNLKVLNAHISTSGSKRFFNIHAQAEKCSDTSISTFKATFEALSKCLS